MSLERTPIKTPEEKLINNEWTMKGYIPPKTCLFISRDVGLCKSKRKNFTENPLNQTTGDPSKYSDTLEKSLKKLWFNNSGAFLKEKRETHTAQAMRRGKSTPGPGHYFKDPPKDEPKKPFKTKLGKFK